MYLGLIICHMQVQNIRCLKEELLLKVSELIVRAFQLATGAGLAFLALSLQKPIELIQYLAVFTTEFIIIL